MLPEYDFSPKSGRVQGKYYAQAREAAELVAIEQDIAEVFPTGEAVNAALRGLINLAETHAQGKRARKLMPRRVGRSATKPQQARRRSS